MFLQSFLPIYDVSSNFLIKFRSLEEKGVVYLILVDTIKKNHIFYTAKAHIGSENYLSKNFEIKNRSFYKLL
jgi:ribosomal protein L31